MGAYILGVDRGITNIKAVLFDLCGNEVKKTVRESGSVNHPYPGWSEQDMNIIWSHTAEAIRGIVADGVKAEEIVAVGLSGQGNGAFLIDKDGIPVRQGIPSLDARATEVVQQWKREGVYGEAVSLLRYPLYEFNPISIMKWLKEHEHDNYKRTRWILFSKDWIKYKLTGEICTDQSDATGAGLVNIVQREYDKRVFDLLGIGECLEKLPKIVLSWEVCGAISKNASQETGLKEGTAVVSGAHDIAACSLGVGGREEGHLTIIVGTWGLNLAVLNKVGEDTRNVIVLQHAIPDRWLAATGDRNSGSTLDWFIDVFCEREREEAQKRQTSVYEIIENKVRDLSPRALIFHPFLFGTMGQPSFRAGFYGLSPSTDKADILRAVYEGIAFSHNMSIEKLGEIVKINGHDVWLAGGGAASNIWGQVFADITGYNIKVAKANEIGARGAALSAGVGVGIFKDHKDANKSLEVRREYFPNAKNVERYGEEFRIYKSLVENLSQASEDMCNLYQNW